MASLIVIEMDFTVLVIFPPTPAKGFFAFEKKANPAKFWENGLLADGWD